MTTELALQEYGEDEVDLDHNAAVTLRRIAGRALIVTPTDDPGRWRLKAGGQVGTIVTPAAKVLIRPKVRGANLFHMLEADGAPLGLGDDSYGYDTAGDLVPAFATFYARQLERALGRGVVRGYVEHEEDLAGIRGRVDLRAQTRFAGRALPAACRFDELTADTKLNRIVAGAAQRLVRLPGVTHPTRRALLAALPAFEGVGPVQPGDLATATTHTRLDAHFRPVERLARLVLERTSILDAAGARNAATFLVDMNVVFEKFVEHRLRRLLAPELQVRGQVRTHLDRDREIAIRPDLVLRQDGLDRYVADTKYKLTADGYGREADYYQLLAYCTALDLPEGLLIYAQHDGSTPSREIEVRHAGVRLRTRAVRLDGTPREVDAHLGDLAAELSERAQDLEAAVLQAPMVAALRPGSVSM